VSSRDAMCLGLVFLPYSRTPLVNILFLEIIKSSCNIEPVDPNIVM